MAIYLQNPCTHWFDMHFLNLNKTGKTIVFGHWHCSAGHKMLGHCKSEFDEDAIWEPCYAEGIIGIDRCTAHTGECNVVVLEDNFIFYLLNSLLENKEKGF